ncbi:TPA: hypothetical protein ACGW3J_005327 [Bacillus paranthracis]
MALVLQKEFSNGVIASNAYAKVERIMGTKERIDFTVDFYLDRNARVENKQSMEQEVFSFTPSVAVGSANFIRQAYLYLKTLNQFRVALDVYEDGQKEENNV